MNTPMWRWERLPDGRYRVLEDIPGTLKEREASIVSAEVFAESCRTSDRGRLGLSTLVEEAPWYAGLGGPALFAEIERRAGLPAGSIADLRRVAMARVLAHQAGQISDPDAAEAIRQHKQCSPRQFDTPASSLASSSQT